MIKKPYVLGSMAVALSGVIGITHAEEQNTETGQQLDSIIIYGDKQEQNLQELPVSVGVLTGDEISESTIQDLNGVYARLANVSMVRGGNEAQFAIRGISVQGVSSDPNSYTAGVYVDDVALDNLGIRYGAMSLWDIEQIEVYRGPQATLQGRNALNGAIYLKTKAPTYDWEHSAQASLAGDNTTRLSYAGGGGLIDDVLAFRFSIDDYQSDGFVNNITRDEDDYAGFDRRTIRGKLLFEPTERLSANLTLAHTRNDMGDNPNVRLDDPYSFEAQSEYDAYHNVDVYNYALDVGYELSDSLTLTSITSVSKDKYDRLDDYDSTSNHAGFIAQDGESEGIAQELRLNFDTGNWSGVAGLYYGEVDRDAHWNLETLYPKANVEQSTLAYLTAPSPYGFGLDAATAGAIFGQVPTFIDVAQDYDSNYKTKNRAIFGETTWRPSNKWAFTFGARYDKEDQTRRQGTLSDVKTVTGNGTVDQLLAGLEGQLQSAPENVKTDYESFLPKAVIQYYWNEDVNTAFMVQKGYRAGGSSVNQKDGSIHDFDPEYTTNYELSLRSILMDGDLLLNANVFYTDWEDQQVDFSPSGDSLDRYTANVGKSQLYGFEIETFAYPTDKLEVFANLGYVKTEFKDFPVTIGGEQTNYNGNEFKGAPNWTMATGFKYRLSGNISFAMDANYQGDSYMKNDNTLKADSRTLVNARLAYETPVWNVSLWATNLTDEEYIVTEYQQQAGLSVQDYATPGTPRMIGTTVSVNF